MYQNSTKATSVHAPRSTSAGYAAAVVVGLVVFYI